jgi:cell division protease FtsH
MKLGKFIYFLFVRVVYFVHTSRLNFFLTHTLFLYLFSSLLPIRTHIYRHAVVGALVPDYDQVQKISIVPRSSGAGGLTFFAPQEGRLESGMYSIQYFESQLAVALGGRLAEEIIYGDDATTTGASNDIQQVASIAKRMVTEWGMSDVVGPICMDDGNMSPMQRMMQGGGSGSIWGDKKLKEVEDEVERLVNNSYITAKNILLENRDLFEQLTRELMEREVVSAEEFQMMLVENNSKVIDYKLIGQERNREKLPFQELPATY